MPYNFCIFDCVSYQAVHGIYGFDFSFYVADCGSLRFVVM